MFMLKVVTLNGIINDIVSENKAVAEYLTEKEISFQGRTITINGENLPASALDRTFAELGVTERATIGITAKSENAAQATVIGNAMVVTSTLTREELESVAKYRPEAMTAYEGEGDKKTPVFKLDLTKRDCGSIDKFGVVFGPTTDEDGHARVTMTFGPELDKDKIIDNLGPAILKLNAMEEALAEQLKGIEEDKAKATAAITFA